MLCIVYLENVMSYVLDFCCKGTVFNIVVVCGMFVFFERGYFLLSITFVFITYKKYIKKEMKGSYTFWQ